MRKVSAVTAALALLSLGLAAQANLITGTFTGNGSGTLAGTPFSNSSFTITAVADTANRYVPAENVYSIDNTSASIAIQGLGTYTFLTATRMFNNLNNGSVGFSRDSGSGVDIFDIQSVSALCSWDMLTSFGPVNAGQGSSYMQWVEPAVYTSGGILVFTNWSNASTFTAEVAPVPEPSSILALFCGIGGLGGVMWRRKPA